jgi:hypothetical protein
MLAAHTADFVVTVVPRASCGSTTDVPAKSKRAETIAATTTVGTGA